LGGIKVGTESNQLAQSAQIKNNGADILTISSTMALK
jgi:hypothetical protein